MAVIKAIAITLGTERDGEWKGKMEDAIRRNGIESNYRLLALQMIERKAKENRKREERANPISSNEKANLIESDKWSKVR